MTHSLTILAIIGALATTALAQSPIPANVFVKTEQMKSKDFTIWTESDPTKYGGIFSGDVGGDGTGKLSFKAGKIKGGAFPVFASGKYTLKIAGTAPTVVQFENAIFYGDSEGVFSVGAFDVIFVKFGKTPGVIIGNVFLPQIK